MLKAIPSTNPVIKLDLKYLIMLLNHKYISPSYFTSKIYFHNIFVKFVMYLSDPFEFSSLFITS